ATLVDRTNEVAERRPGVGGEPASDRQRSGRAGVDAAPAVEDLERVLEPLGEARRQVDRERPRRREQGLDRPVLADGERVEGDLVGVALIAVAGDRSDRI